MKIEFSFLVISFYPMQISHNIQKMFSSIILQGMFIYSMVLYETLVYNGTYMYPTWAIVFGWFLSMISFIWIPGYAIYYMIYRHCGKKVMVCRVCRKNNCVLKYCN